MEELSRQFSLKGKRYIIDADMQNYFGSINHQCLRELLDRRIKDGVIRKMIDKWLKAGVLGNGQLMYPTEGTPQGGAISPLISNVYLHQGVFYLPEIKVPGTYYLLIRHNDQSKTIEVHLNKDSEIHILF